MEGAMRFLLLLYSDPAADRALGPEARRAVVEEHLRYAAMLRERGAMVVSDALTEPEATRTLSFGADGSPMVTDGPFIESKEALGGFYVIECANEAEALDLARHVPRSPTLVAEVRPLAGM
jgi:hypothetical protein